MKTLYASDGSDVSDLVTSMTIKASISGNLIGATVSREMTLTLDSNRMTNADIALLKKSPYKYDGTHYYISEKPSRWTGEVQLVLYDKIGGKMSKRLHKSGAITATPAEIVDNYIKPYLSSNGILVGDETDAIKNAVSSITDKMTISKTTTARTALGWIAGLVGKNVVVINDKITLRAIGQITHAINYMYDYSLIEDKTINRVAYSTADDLIEAGSGVSVLYMDDETPLHSQGIITAIYNKYKGLTFTTCDNISAEAPSEQIYPGDFISYDGHTMIITSIDRTAGGGESMDNITASSSDLELDENDEQLSKKAEDKAKDTALKDSIDGLSNDMDGLKNDVSDLKNASTKAKTADTAHALDTRTTTTAAHKSCEIIVNSDASYQAGKMSEPVGLQIAEQNGAETKTISTITGGVDDLGTDGNGKKLTGYRTRVTLNDDDTTTNYPSFAVDYGVNSGSRGTHMFVVRPWPFAEHNNFRWLAEDDAAWGAITIGLMTAKKIIVGQQSETQIDGVTYPAGIVEIGYNDGSVFHVSHFTTGSEFKTPDGYSTPAPDTYEDGFLKFGDKGGTYTGGVWVYLDEAMTKKAYLRINGGLITGIFTK
jgi:hypothetical protein